MALNGEQQRALMDTILGVGRIAANAELNDRGEELPVTDQELEQLYALLWSWANSERQRRADIVSKKMQEALQDPRNLGRSTARIIDEVIGGDPENLIGQEMTVRGTVTGRMPRMQSTLHIRIPEKPDYGVGRVPKVITGELGAGFDVRDLPRGDLNG